MPPKSSEKDSKNKKEKSEAIRRVLTKDMNIIETTYEKVLSIINNVKEFLKKSKTFPKNGRRIRMGN